MIRPHFVTRRSIVRATLVAVLAAVGLLVFGAGTATATGLPAAQTHVRVPAPETITAVGVSEHITAGQGRGPPLSQAQIVVATGVATKTGSKAGSLVRYDPTVASRNLLGQLGDGYGVTPGGRTVTAHAADRIVNGAPGRSPTTLARVDDNLDNPTRTVYRSANDTVRVYQGKDWVVVSGTGPQHIVTVMIR